MSKFYIEGEQTMDEMSHIDYKAVKGGKGNIPKICPMKYSTLANPRTMSPSQELDEFMECNKKTCAWYCTYPNGEGECAIRSLHELFEGLQDIAKEIGIK